jgi:teichuronic acid biosynthesis glycosyltransferase TuaC
MVSDIEQDQTPKKPFRVLMVTGVYPTESHPHAGTFIKSQVESLRRAGLEIEVLHPSPGPTLLRYTITALQIFKKSLSRKYQVIHGHYGLWCLLCRLQWTLPVVASYLGDDILGTVTADGKHSTKGNIVAAISRTLSYLVDAVIVKSAQMKKAARGPQHKIYVIPNGVNFAQFQPLPRQEARMALGWQQDKYYILFGNNPQIPVKNFALAQAAVDKVRDRGLDVELIVANGLSHETMVHYMNASNALILSSHAEGSPNVVKEAMACNIPIVATDVGDVADVIGQTKGCTVCTPGSIEEMAHGIEIALAHTGRTTGRDDIQHLNSDLVAQRIIDVYAQVTDYKIHSQAPAQPLSKDAVYAKE